jgi:hypothetical protein
MRSNVLIHISGRFKVTGCVSNSPFLFKHTVEKKLSIQKGTSAKNSIYGTTSADSQYGYGGNDFLYGRGGNDKAWGGGGNDRIMGDSGNDYLNGEAGSDNLSGGPGNDKMYGGRDNDRDNDKIYGDAGNDYLNGEAGSDNLSGGSGNDKMYGGSGNDDIFTGPGKDIAWGGIGNDKLHAEGSGSNLYGEVGIDTLYGYNDSFDFMDGGGGNDLVYGSDSDSMRGGSGDDRFVYFEMNKYTGEDVQPSKAIVSGGAGYDVLEFQIGSDGGKSDLEVRMTGESMGTVKIDDQQKMTFTGINEIYDISYPFEYNAALTYHGEDVDTNMRVAGGDYGNTFFAGMGDETFFSGAGDDSYIFVFKEGTMGSDRISYFGQVFPDEPDPYNPGFDTIYFAGAEGKLTTVKSEILNDFGGSTIYRSYYNDGKLAHELEVDAIGLPPISSYDSIIA